MVLTPLRLPGLMHASAKKHGDDRGFFFESLNKRAFEDAGIDFTVHQHNRSRSQAGVVRGLHFQWDKPLAKLIRVARGKALVVAVDIRHDSPTLGEWEARELSEETAEGLFLPAGFASGFCSLADPTEVEYYYDAFYNPDGESNIIWNDSRIGIEWPITDPILSPRDQAAATLDAWLLRPEAQLFSINSR